MDARSDLPGPATLKLCVASSGPPGPSSPPAPQAGQVVALDFRSTPQLEQRMSAGSGPEATNGMTVAAASGVAAEDESEGVGGGDSRGE